MLVKSIFSPRMTLLMSQKPMIALFLVLCMQAGAQNEATSESAAGRVPVISGGAGYIHNVSGGTTTLEPQINPILLVPVGRHVLLESRTDFTGFFQRKQDGTGPYGGHVFTTVEFAQVDWLASTHLIAVAGRYLLPFGLYSERLSPLWIRNLQDSPITAAIGTRNSGAGDGLMLRGVVTQNSSYSLQYTGYFSASSNVEQLGAARTAGGDLSLYFEKARLEVGSSYQRFLQDRHINSNAAYATWQPVRVPLDLKVEVDRSHFGYGYWLEGAYMLSQGPLPAVVKRVQFVGRAQQFVSLNSGGQSLPSVDTKGLDLGLNYLLRDDLRFVSSYGRSFSSQSNANIWNVGFTYRFLLPLWPGRNR
jgi:hypothetical protein